MWVLGGNFGVGHLVELVDFIHVLILSFKKIVDVRDLAPGKGLPYLVVQGWGQFDPVWVKCWVKGQSPPREQIRVEMGRELCGLS